MRRAALAFLLAASAPALVAAPAAPAPAATSKNAIEDLVKQRKYQDAILKVAEMRQAQSKPIVDAESEYWAGRAESALKLTEAARERFQALARTHPDHVRGRDAAIEATTVVLTSLGEGKADTPAEKKVAVTSAKELEATAGKLKDPEGVSRAWYVSGNAWRTAGEDAAAENAWKQSAAVVGATDYPGKATYMLSTLALQRFDVAGARKLVDDCMKKWPAGTQVEKCSRATERLDFIGTPAPPLDVETWVNGPPQDIASLKGKVVLLFFFATWCPHCKAAMPEIAGLKDRQAGKPFQVIALTNNSRGQTTEAVARHVADPQFGMTYPVAVDSPGAGTSVAYHGTGIPAAVLIDKKGVVRWADHPSYLNDAMVQKLLAE